MNRTLLVAAVALVGIGATACTSSGGAGTSSTASSPSVPASTSASAAPSSTAPISTPAPSSAPVSTTASHSPTPSVSASLSPTVTTTAPPTGPPACTPAQLTLTGVRGGATQGVETAGIIFQNSSSTKCSMHGYPAVQLRHNGKNLGQPAVQNPGKARTVVLAHGASAQALLHAVTTCQAAISDHALVRIPGATTSSTIAIELRGCALSVDPIEAG